MVRRLHEKYAVGAVALGLAVAWCGAVVCGAMGQESPPSPTEVESVVNKHFAEIPDYEPGDIISRSEVKSLFIRLKKLDWNVADHKAILAAVPADDGFLVTSLRTKSGRKFMRSIAGYPEAYDRLERLARLPYGKRTVRALIRGPDGYKMIEYMTTTAGGIDLGKQLSNTPKGKDFNEPTGHLYTTGLLLKRLKKGSASTAKSRDNRG